MFSVKVVTKIQLNSYTDARTFIQTVNQSGITQQEIIDEGKCKIFTYLKVCILL